MCICMLRTGMLGQSSALCSLQDAPGENHNGFLATLSSGMLEILVSIYHMLASRVLEVWPSHSRLVPFISKEGSPGGAVGLDLDRCCIRVEQGALESDREEGLILSTRLLDGSQICSDKAS